MIPVDSNSQDACFYLNKHLTQPIIDACTHCHLGPHSADVQTCKAERPPLALLCVNVYELSVKLPDQVREELREKTEQAIDNSGLIEQLSV